MKIIIALVALLAVFPVYNYEVSRFNECVNKCARSQTESARILRNSLCENPAERTYHGDKAYELCRQAEMELDEGLYGCSLRVWWREGEIYHLYYRVAESQWVLLAIILFTIFVFVNAFFQYCAQMQAFNAYARLQDNKALEWYDTR